MKRYSLKRLVSLLLTMCMCATLIVMPTSKVDAAVDMGVWNNQLYEMSMRFGGSNTCNISGGAHYVQDGLLYKWGNCTNGGMNEYSTDSPQVVPPSVFGGNKVIQLAGEVHGFMVVTTDGINTQLYGFKQNSDSYYRGCISNQSGYKNVVGNEKIVNIVSLFSGGWAILTDKGNVFYCGSQWINGQANVVKKLVMPNYPNTKIVQLAKYNTQKMSLIDADGNLYITNGDSNAVRYDKSYFGNSTVKLVSGSNGYTSNILILTNDGKIYEMGNEIPADIGLGVSRSSVTTPRLKTMPTVPGNGAKYIWVYNAPYVSIALREDNTLWGWGMNEARHNYPLHNNTGYAIIGTPQQIFKDATDLGRVLYVQNGIHTSSYDGGIRVYTTSGVYYQGQSNYGCAGDGRKDFANWTKNAPNFNQNGPNSYYKMNNQSLGNYRGSTGDFPTFWNESMRGVKPDWLGPQLPKAGSVIVKVADVLGNEVDCSTPEKTLLAAGEKYTAKVYINNIGKMNMFGIPLSFDNTKIRIATDPVKAFDGENILPSREAVPNVKSPTSYIRDSINSSSWTRGQLTNTEVGKTNTEGGYPIVSNKYGFISVHGMAENDANGNPPIIEGERLIYEFDFYAIGDTNGQANTIFTPFVDRNPNDKLAHDALVSAEYANGKYLYTTPLGETHIDPITGAEVHGISGTFSEIKSPALINKLVPISSAIVLPTVDAGTPKNAIDNATKVITYELDRNLKANVDLEIDKLFPKNASYTKSLRWEFAVEGGGNVSDYVSVNPSTIGMKNQFKVFQERGGMAGGTKLEGTTVITLKIRDNDGVDLSAKPSSTNPQNKTIPLIKFKISKNNSPKAVNIISSEGENTTTPKPTPFDTLGVTYTFRPGFTDYAPTGTTPKTDSTVEQHPTAPLYNSQDNHEVSWSIIDEDNRNLTNDPLNPFDMNLVPNQTTKTTELSLKVARTYPKKVRIVLSSLYAEEGKTSPMASWEVSVKLSAGALEVTPDFIILYPTQQFNIDSIKTRVTPLDAVTQDVYLVDATPLDADTNLAININTGKMSAGYTGITLTDAMISAANGSYKKALVDNFANKAGILRYAVRDTTITKDVLIFVVDINSDILNIKATNNKGNKEDTLTIAFGTNKDGVRTGLKDGDKIQFYDNALSNDTTDIPKRILLGEIIFVMNVDPNGMTGKQLIVNPSNGLGEATVNMLNTFPDKAQLGYNAQGGYAGIRLQRKGPDGNYGAWQDLVPAQYEAEGGSIAGNVSLIGRSNSEQATAMIEVSHAGDSASKTYTSEGGYFKIDNWVQGRETNLVFHKDNYLDRIVKLSKDTKAKKGSIDEKTGGDLLVIADNSSKINSITLWPGALSNRNQIKRSDVVSYVQNWYGKNSDIDPTNFESFNFDDTAASQYIEMEDLALMLKFVGQRTENYPVWVIPAHLAAE